MSFVTKLPLLGRSPATLFALLPRPLPLCFKRDASRLSAIHDGLRRSDKTRPQGPKEIRQRPGEDEYLSPAERRRQRAVARLNPITYKIRKGKKDITEEPGPPRKSKAARFADPRDPFGSGSLVKKFKTGQLFAEFEGQGQGQGKRDGHMQHDDFARQMMTPDSGDHLGPRKRGSSSRSPGTPPGGRSRPWGERDQGTRRAPVQADGRARFDMFDRPDRGESLSRRSSQPEDYHGSRNPSSRSSYRPERRSDQSTFDSPYRSERSASVSRRSSEPLDFDRSRGPSSRSSFRPERTRFDEAKSDSPHRPSRPSRSDQADEANEADGLQARKPKRQDAPVSLHYTTAASQFLYGTSTVEAALKASRRKLYRLYIYNGKDRRSKSLDKDRFLGELARRRGVRVEHVDEAALPMMNKMSGNRPHNGHILEASPLPQMPIKALGELSGEAGGPGFRVAVGHQSYEETQVNGTSEFVPMEPSSRKPLVLMVDEVLDPGNLGAILRTASFMGVTAVAVSKRGSAPVTPVVLKASAGAAESLTMFSVESTADLLKDSKENGWKVYAAVAPHGGSTRLQVDTMDVEKDDPLLKTPCVLVVGSEGEGLSRALRRAADVEVSIPNLSGSDVVDSLNVSVAAGLLCAAFLRGKAKTFNIGVEDAGAIF